MEISTILLFVLAVALLVAMAWYALTHEAPEKAPSRGAISAEASAAAARDLAQAVAGKPLTVVRVYKGSQQADAVGAFQRESIALAEIGYRPVSQSWAQGQWGCGAWLVALLLCLLVIGLLVFLFMLIVKPEGTLTVTYELADAAAPQALPPTSGSVRERLAQLDDLHTSGVISDEEYAAKRAKVIDAL